MAFSNSLIAWLMHTVVLVLLLILKRQKYYSSTVHFVKSCSTCLQHQKLPHRQCGSVCILGHCPKQQAWSVTWHLPSRTPCFICFWMTLTTSFFLTETWTSRPRWPSTRLSVSQRYFVVALARSGSYIAVTSRRLNNSTFRAFNECLDYTGGTKSPT